ncbi:MAG: acetoacetate decarboxylase family protein [Acidimicrobiia bacterium]
MTSDDRWIEKDEAWLAQQASMPELAKATYRMPLGYGRAPGPRNVPMSKSAFGRRTSTTITRVIALTDAKELAKLLPPGLELDGEPELDARLMTVHNCYWLAGLPYNDLILRIPNVVSVRDGEPIRGVYGPAMWHNRPDNAISNREELGYAALWADFTAAIPRGPSAYEVQGSWNGFRFFDMRVDNLDEGRHLDLTDLAPEDERLADHLRATVFVYKYVPQGYSSPGADVSRLITNKMAEYWKVSSDYWKAEGDQSPESPVKPVTAPEHPVFVRRGTGSFRFNEARWEDMPTQYHVVNRLASLPLLEFRYATHMTGAGYATASRPAAGQS